MNGGPVDIMQTLHSGLLVDPSNSKQIAAACLKILTNSEIWDQMNRNGARTGLEQSQDILFHMQANQRTLDVGFWWIYQGLPLVSLEI